MGAKKKTMYDYLSAYIREKEKEKPPLTDCESPKKPKKKIEIKVLVLGFSDRDEIDNIRKALKDQRVDMTVKTLQEISASKDLTAYDIAIVDSIRFNALPALGHDNLTRIYKTDMLLHCTGIEHISQMSYYKLSDTYILTKTQGKEEYFNILLKEVTDRVACNVFRRVRWKRRRIWSQIQNACHYMFSKLYMKGIWAALTDNSIDPRIYQTISNHKPGSVKCNFFMYFAIINNEKALRNPIIVEFKDIVKEGKNSNDKSATS